MVNKRINGCAGVIVSGRKLFEELVFYYMGLVNGNDINNMVPIIDNLRGSPNNKPVILYPKTTKRLVYPPAERASYRIHRVAKFDLVTGRQIKGKLSAPPLTSVFAKRSHQLRH